MGRALGRFSGLMSCALALLSACSGHHAGSDAGPLDAGPTDGGPVDAGAPGWDGSLGPVSLSCDGGGSIVMTPPATFAPMEVDGLLWPLLFSLPVVTDATMDTGFLQVLEQLGVDTVAFFPNIESYGTYGQRYANAIAAARAAGLRIRIGYKEGPAGYLLGQTPAFPGQTSGQTTTYAQYLDAGVMFETQLAQTFHPDAFTVVEEFGTSMTEIGGSFTTAEWLDFVAQAAKAVKEATDGGTEVWVAVLPSDPTDQAVVKAGLLQVPNLDGIGFDEYGNADICSWQKTFAEGAADIADAGLKSGFTETWWGALSYQPSVDTTANMPAEADWLRGMMYDSQNIGATGDFMPWFTEKLVISVPDGYGSSDTLAAAQTLSGEVAAALDAGARTDVFYEWQATIAQVRGH